MPAPRQTVRFNAVKMVFWQFVVVVVLSLLLYILQGAQIGLSVLFGGVAYCLPNLIFVWRVFSHATAREAKQFLIAFMVGELTKLFLGAILVVVTVKFLPVKIVWVLIGYIIAIMAFWIVSFISMSHE